MGDWEDVFGPEMGVGSRLVSQDNDLKSGNATKGKKQSFIVSLGD